MLHIRNAKVKQSMKVAQHPPCTYLPAQRTCQEWPPQAEAALVIEHIFEFVVIRDSKSAFFCARDRTRITKWLACLCHTAKKKTVRDVDERGEPRGAS